MGARTRSRTVCSYIRTVTSRSTAKGSMLGNRVPWGALERLELHEWKHSRAVLRGGGGGDATPLPGADGKGRSRLPVTADASRAHEPRRKPRTRQPPTLLISDILEWNWLPCL